MVVEISLLYTSPAKVAVIWRLRFWMDRVKVETVTHLSLMDLKFDDSFTLLLILSLYLARYFSKCTTVIKYAAQSPPTIVVGISLFYTSPN